MPVAQLDRVSDSDSEGRAFESHRAYQKRKDAFGCLFFFGIGEHISSADFQVSALIRRERQPYGFLPHYLSIFPSFPSPFCTVRLKFFIKGARFLAGTFSYLVSGNISPMRFLSSCPDEINWNWFVRPRFSPKTFPSDQYSSPTER